MEGNEYKISISRSMGFIWRIGNGARLHIGMILGSDVEKAINYLKV
jgi:hypothetical protein